MVSAEATVALGQPGVYGPDNIANTTNDISGAAALAAAIKQSNQTQPAVSQAFSAAIATALNQSTEATAVLIATAVMVDSSTAVAITAQGVQQVQPLDHSASVVLSTSHFSLELMCLAIQKAQTWAAAICMCLLDLELKRVDHLCFC